MEKGGAEIRKPRTKSKKTKSKSKRTTRKRPSTSKQEKLFFSPSPTPLKKYKPTFSPNVPTFRDFLPCFSQNLPTPTPTPIQSYAQDTRLRVCTRSRSQRICFFAFTLHIIPQQTVYQSVACEGKPCIHLHLHRNNL